MLDSSSYGSRIGPCRTSLNPCFEKTNLLHFFYISVPLPAPPAPIRSLPVFTHSIVNEGVFLNSIRLYHSDLSFLHTVISAENPNVRESHFFYKNCVDLSAKREIIRLLAVRGIQKLKIQWQKLRLIKTWLWTWIFDFFCYKAVALRNTPNIGALTELTTGTPS